MNSLEITNSVIGCRACKFRDYLDYGDLPSIGVGKTPADIMLINFKATKESHLIEKPVCARNELLLRKMLQMAGISYSSTYLTNLIKCNGPITPAKVLLQNGSTCYHTHLVHEIRLVQPKAIVCFGTTVPKVLIGDMSATVSSEYEYNSIPLYVVYSLEHLYRRGKAYMDEAIKTLQKAKLCLNQ